MELGEEALNTLINKFMETPAGEKIASNETVSLLLQEQDQLKKAFTVLTLKEGENQGKNDEQIEKKKLELSDKISSVNKKIADRKPSFKYTVESTEKNDEGKLIKVQVNYVYDIQGRVYDATTTKPLQGVRVVPGVYADIAPPPTSNLAQTELSTTEINIDPSNYTYVPVSYLNVELDSEKESGVNVYKKSTTKTITDKDGYFKIKITLPTIAFNSTTPLFFALIFTSKGYVPQNTLIVKGDKTIKTDLKAISVTSIKEVANTIKKETIVKANEFLDKKVEKYVMEPVELVLNTRQKSVSKLHKIVQEKLLPLAIQLLLAFGISKITEENQKTCPRKEQLELIIRKRNGVTRQLNNIYKSVATNTAIAGVFALLAKQLKGISMKIDSLPIPQATGLPPSKDFGGLISSQLYSSTGKLQRISKLLDEISDNNKQLNKKLILALIYILAGIITVLLLLKTIDNMSQECAEELGLEVEQLAFDQELLDLTIEQGLDGNPAINELNGFILSVETDDQNPVGTLKRRRAIAKDNRGITLLKGELSFSSNDQILLDELIFYIQQNNLKA